MHHLRIATIAVIFLSCSSLALTQVQTPAATAPSGSLTGTVLNSATGQPAEGVQVSIVAGQPIPERGVETLEKPSAKTPQTTKVLSALVLAGRELMPERKVYSVLTDSGGRFVFNELAAESYSLSLRADGYIFQIHGEKPNSQTWLPLAVKDGQTDVGQIRISPATKITGTVVNSTGSSIAGIPVYLLDARIAIDVDGRKNFRVVGEASTDADGRYVFEKVSAGRYCIAAGSFAKPETLRVSAADRTGVRVPAVLPYPFTFYPSGSDAGVASQIDVTAGGQVALGELIVRNVELRAIRGRVVDSITGKPPSSVRVTLNASFPFLRAGRDTREILSVRYTQATGFFEATNLIPGTYRIDADLPRPPAPSTEVAITRVGDISSQSAFQILELRNEDVQDLVLRVPSNGKVGGKVVVADGKPLPVVDLDLPFPLQLMVRPLGPLQPAPVVTGILITDGTFEVGTTLDGKYRFYLGPLKDNYFVSETQLNGVRLTNGILDVSKDLNTELLITLSRGGEVQGSVIDKKGQPVSQAQGILLPDPLPEIIPFYSELYADASGSFRVESMPPGNYKIYVWDGVESYQYFDRDRLQRTHAQATSVHVDKGARATTSVPIIIP